MLLLSFLPIVAFVIVDSFLGVRAAVVSAIVLAVLEVVYSLSVFGEIDGLTWGSFALVVVFGLVSFKTKNEMIFKFQPVCLGVVFGCVLLYMQFFQTPLLLIMVEKYRHLFPSEMQAVMKQEMYLATLGKCSLTLGVGCFLHAGIVAYAALKLNNWWWLFLRTMGFYLMSFLAVIAAVVI